MKNHKVNYKKYITLIALLAISATGIATVTENVNNSVKYDVVDSEQEVKKITSITPANTKGAITLSYGTKVDEVDWDSIFNFVDQEGEPIDESLLNVEYKEIIPGATGSLRSVQEAFDNNLKEENYEEATYMSFYITSIANLKSDNAVKWRPHNWNYYSLKVNSKNENPLINTKEPYTTAYEGKPYKEWTNIEFSDYEDDRDGKSMQRLVEYPYDFDKDSMKPGVFTIYYGVTDSQGVYKETLETLTVLEVKPPTINANINTINATYEELDLLKTLDITATDSLDGDVTDSLEIVDTDLNLRKEGIYKLKVRARNSYSKTTEENIEVKVKADAPNLKVNNIEIVQSKDTFNPYKQLEFEATDKVDGDITDKVIIEGEVNLNEVGRQLLKVKVTNSNNKTTTKTVTVQITPKKVEEIPSTPILPSTPVTPEKPETDIPMTDLEPSTPVTPEKPETDIPATPLEPSTPVTPEKPEVKPETKPEVKPETKPEVKPEVKPETKPEAKPENKEEAPIKKEKEKVKDNVDLKKEEIKVPEEEKVKEEVKEEKKNGPDKLLQTDITSLNTAAKAFIGMFTASNGLYLFKIRKK